MKRLLLCVVVMFSLAGGALAETPERKGGEMLSAFDALMKTARLSDGILDVGDKAIDVWDLAIPAYLKVYWEGMRIKDTLFGINKKTGEQVYVIVFVPLDGREDMPQDAQAIYALKDAGKTDKRKPIFRVGKMLGFFADGKAVDESTEIPKGPPPKPSEQDKTKDRGIAI